MAENVVVFQFKASKKVVFSLRFCDQFEIVATEQAPKKLEI